MVVDEIRDLKRQIQALQEELEEIRRELDAQRNMNHLIAWSHCESRLKSGMSRVAARIELTEAERKELERRELAHSTAYRDRQPAQVILLASRRLE